MSYMSPLSETELIDIKSKHPEIDDADFFKIVTMAHGHTLTGIPAQWALYKAIEYIVRNEIPGDIVECGVWNGGSVLIAACALLHFGDTSRRIYLYDTFEGVPRPEKIDIDCRGSSALTKWVYMRIRGKLWGFGGTVDVVKDVIALSNYPTDNFIFVKGMVEDTIPSQLPETISLLRLDTDLYKSTYHELVHCYPLISSGGVMIIDDYGYYLGCRQATDKYISENKLRLFLARLDGSGHITVKP
jgi:O-methyltransferase